jgi:hypothetical protein
MIQTTLVLGKSAFDREQAIADELTLIPSFQKTAILLEGLGSGKTLLEPKENVVIVRIAAGCLCCSNNMIMRIYLNRLIQQKPQQLYLSLSTGTHLEQIKQFLTAPDYKNVLELTKVLNLNPITT